MRNGGALFAKSQMRSLRLSAGRSVLQGSNFPLGRINGGMKKWLKRVALLFVFLAVAAQFYPTPKNSGAIKGAGHVANVFPVPAEVEAILVKACYDCHSNGTRYPWYSRLQPVAWWMGQHVVDGKRHLNFSEFTSYEPKRRKSKLQAVADEVDMGHMPLPSYTWAHRDAVLTEAEKALVVAWVEETLENLESK